MNIEESLHPWNKDSLVMMYALFNMLLVVFARILMREDLCIYVLSDSDLQFSFVSVTSLSGFGVRVMVLS